MTIILFLIDTSSSMCQKALVNGVQKTYLDIAKSAVETFLKYRQRTQDCMGDRYMLLTFEEPPANVKAGWKENHATFMNELKNLQSTGLTSMGESLKNAFDLLNLNRMQSGIDTYGQGRCPFYLEPSVIIVISDGGRYSYRNGVHQDIILPLNTQIPGTKFTKEPFRWDQRLFSLVLRMSGNRTDERVEGKVPHDDSPIERMCEVTGGRSYRIRSHYVLNQCIESLVQKVQPGVVLQFEPMLPKDITQVNNEALQDIVFPPTKKMIYVPKHISQKTFPIGYWPLPEPYWPDPKALTLPPRDAHPKLKIVTPAVDEPQMVRNFPIDKYEIEASPLTLQILQKREMNKCWQVIISNGMHGFELPFGYLKASPNFSQVHLYVLAYNYPALLPLLNDLIHKYNMSPPNDLMYKFNAYVRSIPPYYCPFLRKALLNINVPYPLLQFLLPENVDNYLSSNIANQLKHIKNTAKQDQENLCMKVYKQLKQPKPPYRQVETAKLNPGVPLRRELVRHPLLRDTFAKLHAEIEPLENYTIVVPQLTRQASAKSYRNPFDIPRRDIIEEISRMRETFLRPTPTSLIAKDSGHCLPIAEMGNYQEYLKNKDIPLRELEPTNVRQHMFGNPYKKDKHMVMVDEADLSDVAPMKSPNNGAVGGGPIIPMPGGVMIGLTKKLDPARTRKRKAGPIRKDFIFRRLSLDVRPSSSVCSTGNLNTTGGSLTDYEDDAASDTSSISSGMSDDSDTDRTMDSFEFNDEATEQDFPLNGFVRNFINGNDESCESIEMNNITTVGANVSTGNGNNVATMLQQTPTTPSLSLISQTSIITNGPMAINHHHQQQHHHMLQQQPIMPVVNIMPPMSPAPHTAYLGVNYAQTVLMPSSTDVISTVSPAGLTTTTHGLGNLAPPGATMPMPTPLQTSGGGIYAAHQLNGNLAVSATTVMAVAAAYGNNLNNISVVQQQQQPIITPTISAVPTMLVAAAPNLQQQQLQPAAAPQAIVVNSVPTHTPVSVPAPTPTTDINDAQEISRILQQCHNGNNSNNNNNLEIENEAQLTPITAGVAAAPAIFSTLLQTANAGAAALNTTTTTTTLSNSFDNLKREGSNHQNQNHQNHNQNSHITTNHHTIIINNHVNHKRRNNGLPPSPNLLNLIPISEEQRDAARKHNIDIRAQIFRDIRRPGRNYSQLLEHLNLVKGDFDMKSNFVQMCITESLRFRRKQMVNCIESWWEKQQKQQLQQQQLAITTTLSPS